jgi:hypothetical protein
MRMSQARRVTATFAIDRHTLTVATAHGVAAPSSSSAYDYGTAVSPRVTGTVTSGGTQNVCRGWAMTGNAPLIGGATNFAMVVTNDAALTWLWNTNYWLDVLAGPNGRVEATNGWQAAGSRATALAVADRYHHFARWVGTANSTQNPLPLSMGQTHRVTAQFEENVATNHTPQSWLAQYGLTNGTWDFEAMADRDGDGMAAWEEFIAGTCPTNRNASFEFFGIVRPGTNLMQVIDWPTVAGRRYTVYGSTNLFGGPWVALYSMDGGGVLRFTNRVQRLGPGYFRLGVRLNGVK